MADLLELSVAEAATRIQAVELSREEYFEAWREAAAGDELNAYLWRAEDRAVESDGPLEGIPVAVKDLFCTEAVQTTAGSRILEGHRPLYTATAVRRLTEAGAEVLGKTNMDEFAMGSSNENSAYGPVLNPWDRCARARRLLRGLGGGRRRRPRALRDRDRHRRLDPPAGGALRDRRAEADLRGDLALRDDRLRLLARPVRAADPRRHRRRPAARGDAGAGTPATRPRSGSRAAIAGPSREDLTGLRFAVPAELAQGAIERRRARGLRGDAEADRGARAARSPRWRCRNAEHGISAYYVIAPAEASSNLSRYDGVRYGMRAEADGDVVEMYESTRAAGFGDEVKRRIMLGTYALSSGYYDAYYGQAQKVRTRIAEDFAAAFGSFDFVVTPTSPSVAFGLGEKTDDPLAMYMNDFFTVPMSLAGIPAISIPAGLAEPEGGGPRLPVGFQIAAPAFAEQRLLDAAYALEQAIGFDAKPGERRRWLSWRR